jgi:hypothetical protein
MESDGGEDLSWFWRGWYMNNWTLDLAVKSTTYVDGNPAKGAIVSIENRGQLVMPVTVQVDFHDASHQRFRLPVETWIQKSVATLTLQSTQPVSAVTIDPDHVLPGRYQNTSALLPQVK